MGCVRRLEEVLSAEESCCVCVEGASGTGKTLCVKEATRRVGGDIFDWKEESDPSYFNFQSGRTDEQNCTKKPGKTSGKASRSTSNGEGIGKKGGRGKEKRSDDWGELRSRGGKAQYSLHDADSKNLLSLLRPANWDESCSVRPPPICVLADNVEDLFTENKTVIQLLTKKAAVITGKKHISSSSKRSGNYDGGRSVHLLLTYDPSKLEARIVAQLRGMATVPAVRVDHPLPQETRDYVLHALSSPESGQNQLLTSTGAGSTSFASLEGFLDRFVDWSCGVEVAFRRARKAIRHAQREEAMGQDAAAAVVDEEDGERDQDDRAWDVSFKYSGFKIDSLSNCLRGAEGIRIDDLSQIDLPSALADGLFLSNVLIEGLKPEMYDEQVKNTAMAIHECVSSICHRAPSPAP